MADRVTNSATTLVTFDIDGTLLKSVGTDSNRMHKEAFTAALGDVCGLAEASIDEINHHGSTDSLILVAMQEKHGVDKETAMARLPELYAAMVRSAEAAKPHAATGLEVLPGVVELLAALQARSDCVVGLVTGNVAEIAWLKMEAVGIESLFSQPRFGGFGSEFCSGDHSVAGKAADRAELVLQARAKALQRHPTIAVHVHVGDAPADIKAGEASGQGARQGEAFALGVCTGTFGREELQEVARSSSTMILDSLADTAASIKALGLA